VPVSAATGLDIDPPVRKSRNCCRHRSPLSAPTKSPTATGDFGRGVGPRKIFRLPARSAAAATVVVGDRSGRSAPHWATVYVERDNQRGILIAPGRQDEEVAAARVPTWSGCSEEGLSEVRAREGLGAARRR
jgi:hypothetical protein